jgi:hypothetical protein
VTPLTESLFRLGVSPPGRDGIDFILNDNAVACLAPNLPDGAITVLLLSIPVTPIADTLPEGPETFEVSLVNPSGAALGPKPANGTLADDDSIGYGAPSIDPAVERGVFLWQDCASGAWSPRMRSGTACAEHGGRLVATAPFRASHHSAWKSPTCSTPPAIRPSSTTLNSTSAPATWTASTLHRLPGAARVYNRHHLLVYESSSVRVNSPCPPLTSARCRVVDQGRHPALHPGYRTAKNL